MVELIEIKTCTAFWSIEGKIFRFQRRKKTSDEDTKTAIEKYIEIMIDKGYLIESDCVSKVGKTLSDTIMIHIGMELYKDKFCDMFKWFSVKYMEIWESSQAMFGTNRITNYGVFKLMFHNEFIISDIGYGAVLKCIEGDNSIFQNIFEKVKREFWYKITEQKVLSGEMLEHISKKIGLGYTGKLINEVDKDILKEYFNGIASNFTKSREIISLKRFYCKMFGEYKYSLSEKRFPDELVVLIKEIVKREYELQCKKFVAENFAHSLVDENLWHWFYMNGPSLFMTTLDFEKIKCVSIRYEVKHFMRERYHSTSSGRDTILDSIIFALNIMTENNSEIHYFADIDEVDARQLYMHMERQYTEETGKSVSNIMRVFSSMAVVVDYLMSDRRDKGILTPKPHQNVFAKFRFHNVKEYKKRTEIIPEEVIEQIEMHILEIQPVYVLMYRIFSATGMRMKEVQFLEKDCLEKSRYEEFVQLRYKQYKTLTSRRKRGLPDYHKVMISKELADDITKQIAASKEIRDTSQLPYIFMRFDKNIHPTMVNMESYVLAINKLIKKHNICDEFGNLWHFTSKQHRKTIAVTLIENGASVDELSYWLGHLSRSTASTYYSEVRKAKLAELNTEFFRRKFELEISQEQLSQYTEEERKLLYVDFRLEKRRVEFGFCLRKVADGSCDKRNSLVNCVNCKNLCTGAKYLRYWQMMYSEQQKVVKELERIYFENKITEYHDFREYRQAKNLLNGYENIIKKIEEGESK